MASRRPITSCWTRISDVTACIAGTRSHRSPHWRAASSIGSKGSRDMTGNLVDRRPASVGDALEQLVGGGVGVALPRHHGGGEVVELGATVDVAPPLPQ